LFFFFFINNLGCLSELGSDDSRHDLNEHVSIRIAEGNGLTTNHHHIALRLIEASERVNLSISKAIANVG